MLPKYSRSEKKKKLQRMFNNVYHTELHHFGVGQVP